MSVLEWDKTGERYYENGVSKGVLYRINSNGEYKPGVAWNGLTSVNESPDGADPNELWADNMKYAVLYSAETFGFTIEAYTYPEEWAACDGSAEPVSGVYIGQQKRQGFGFCYRTEIGNDTPTDTDDGYKLHLIYGCMAQPSDRDYETINDSPDAVQFSWECTTTPVNVAGYKPTSTIVIDSTKVDAATLATLEEALYGTSGTDPYLPTPNQILTLMNSNPYTEVDTTEESITNPYSAGLYTKIGNDYILTDDTTVDSDKTYYRRTPIV